MSSSQNQLNKFQNYSLSYFHIRDKLLSDNKFQRRLNEIKSKNSSVKTIQCGKTFAVSSERKRPIVSNENYYNYFKNNFSKSKPYDADDQSNTFSEFSERQNKIRTMNGCSSYSHIPVNLKKSLPPLQLVSHSNPTLHITNLNMTGTQGKFMTGTLNSLKQTHLNFSTNNLNKINHLDFMQHYKPKANKNSHQISSTNFIKITATAMNLNTTHCSAKSNRSLSREKVRELQIDNIRNKKRLERAKASSPLSKNEIKKSADHLSRISERIRKIKPFDEILQKIKNVKTVFNLKN